MGTVAILAQAQPCWLKRSEWVAMAFPSSQRPRSTVFHVGHVEVLRQRALMIAESLAGGGNDKYFLVTVPPFVACLCAGGAENGDAGQV